MKENKVKLLDGLLTDCFKKVRDNYYNKIDVKPHLETYITSENMAYAEPEFTGKYLDICAYYYETEGDERTLEKGKAVAYAAIKGQRADGYLGFLPEGKETERFSIWNHVFSMYGLTRMYEVTGDKEIFAAVLKSADYLLELYADVRNPDILEAGNYGSQNISSLFSMMHLYSVTKDEKYADYVKRILEYCETTNMNLLSYESILNLRSRKGIEMIVVYLGVLIYGVQCNCEKAIDAARRYWQELNDTQIRNTGNGTVEEKWAEGGNLPQLLPTEEKPNETCVAVGWIELSLMLFYVYKDAKYLDGIEKTLFNHMLGSLEKAGEDFAYYQGNYGTKIFRTDGGMYQCCRYRGFTILSYLKEYIYYVDENTVIPMVYSSAEYNADGLKVVQTTEYPTNGVINYHVENANAPKTLKLRIPVWCDAYTVKVNGETQDIKCQDGYVNICLVTGTTDVQLSLEFKIVKTKCEIDDDKYVEIKYGPLLLALDTHFGNELWHRIDADADVERVDTEGKSIVHFVTDGAHLVDFASAGSNVPGTDTYTVFIKRK